MPRGWRLAELEKEWGVLHLSRPTFSHRPRTRVYTGRTRARKRKIKRHQTHTHTTPKNTHTLRVRVRILHTCKSVRVLAYA
jgi:hypothetical protein